MDGDRRIKRTKRAEKGLLRTEWREAETLGVNSGQKETRKRERRRKRARPRPSANVIGRVEWREARGGGVLAKRGLTTAKGGSQRGNGRSVLWRGRKRQEPARFKYTADRATIGVEEVLEVLEGGREGAAQTQTVEAVTKQGQARKAKKARMTRQGRYGRPCTSSGEDTVTARGVKRRGPGQGEERSLVVRRGPPRKDCEENPRHRRRAMLKRQNWTGPAKGYSRKGGRVGTNQPTGM